MLLTDLESVKPRIKGLGFSRLDRGRIPDDVNVVWKPHWGSQSLALASPAMETLYHGPRGPGKTDCQIFRFRRNVGVGYGAFWRGVIFDVEYKNLDDIVAKSLKWFPQFNDGAVFLRSAKDYKWVWPTGEELLFRTGSAKEDYNQFHGHEYPFIGFNELTKQSNSDFFDAIKSCNRSSFVPEVNSPDPSNPLPPIPLEIFCTTNPHGVGHSWVKRYFIDAGEPGEIVTREIKILSPTTRKEAVVKITKTHIFGHWIENGKLPDSYIAGLVDISDENKRKAWAHGDWNVTAGGALDDVWDHRYVRRPRFKIPPQWKKDRCFDWGSTVPFYVGWFAECDGSEVEVPIGIDGKTVWWGPPKGSLILFNEWYGSTSWTSNVGLRIGPRAVAEGICARERIMREKCWIVGEVKPGPADNQIHNQNDADTDSIAKRMAAMKVKWTESDKTPGSRKNGLEIMRDMLRSSVTGDGAGFFIMDNCQAALNILPLLQRDIKDPDDAASDGQDHPWDAVRYRILDRKRQFGAIESRFYGGA